MKKIRYFFKKVFYPQKYTISIFIQCLISFFLVGGLFITEAVLYKNAEIKYNYLPQNCIYEETDITLEKINEYSLERKKILQGIIQKEISHIDYVMYTDIRVGKERYRMFFLDDIKSNMAFIQYSKCQFTDIGEGEAFVSQKIFDAINIDDKYYFEYNEENKLAFPSIRCLYSYSINSSDNASDKYIFVTYTYYEKIKEYIDTLYMDKIIYTFYDDINMEDVKELSKNNIDNLWGKAIELSIELEMVEPFFKVIYIFIIVMIIISFISIGWLIIEKVINDYDYNYIKNIFYLNKGKICLTESMHIEIIVLLSFIITTILLYFVNLILYLKLSFFIEINLLYYCLFLSYAVIFFVISFLASIFINTIKSRVN